MSYIFTETQKDKIIRQWGRGIYLKILCETELYSQKWKLYDLNFLEYYSINAIFFCKSELYGDCVLKIGSNLQDIEFICEYNVLREYDGKRFIKVFESDIDIENGKKIMLLERCINGKMLSEEQSLEKRLAVFSELFNGLHIEPKNPEIYNTYVNWLCCTAENMKNREDFKELYEHMLKAKELCLELCEKYNKKMLLHIDLFGDNIVRNNSEYKIIDPKGVTGDPVFDTAQYIFAECCENCLQPENIEIILNYFEKSLDISNKILRKCFYIETVRFICYYALEDGAGKWDIDRVKFAEAVMNKGK